MNTEWIKLPEFRQDSSNRRIYNAKCLKCGKEFKNHRYMNDHIKICKGQNNNSEMPIEKVLIPHENPTNNIFLTQFHIDLIEMMISSNIAFYQLQNEYFLKIFINLGITKSFLPTQNIFRDLVIRYSEIVNENNLKLFENKSISLVIDGTTSWNRTLYQFSLFYPGILRHFSLIQIEKATGDNIRNIFNLICEHLRKRNISIVGVTTDNVSNLVSCFNTLYDDVINGKYSFPIIRFACAAHTSQLLIEDLKKEFVTFSDTIQKVKEFLHWLRRKIIITECKSYGLTNSPHIYQSQGGIRY